MTAPDVLVVGAGIVGAACAAELARGGCRVQVLEAGHGGGGSTAAAMGHVVVMDDSPAQLILSLHSRRLWDQAAELLPPSVERDVCGTLWLAADEEEMAAARRKAAGYEAAGADVELLDSRQLADAEPALREGLAGALRIPGDSVIYPPAAVTALLREAERLGAELRQGCPVRRLDGGGAELASGERIDAGWVVDAAGLAALDLLPRGLPGHVLRPRKGHLVITERGPRLCHHQLVELGYLKSAHGSAQTSVAFNLQPRLTGQLLIGSSRQFDAQGDEVETTILARMVRLAIDLVPRLAELRAVRAWTGFRAATDDHLPLIGPVPGEPNLLLAAGHEGLGITSSLATAELVADHVLGRESQIDPAPYRPDRPGATR